MNRFIALCLFVFGAAACQQEDAMELIPQQQFEGVIDGKRVQLFTLSNDKGLTAQITNYGGRVVSLWTPDKNGVFNDVVLGYDSLEKYLNSNEVYYGALIGRYGNRIADGQFTLNEENYQLATNNGAHHLHGGHKGFHNVVWDVQQASESVLQLHYISKDMEEGYPGNLEVTVTYQVTHDNALQIEYRATTDQPTPVNLTHHSFFNLKGAGNGTINDHKLQINASFYTPIDKELIPFGTMETVKRTPFDFLTPKAIGAALNDPIVQLDNGHGYDHNFVLDLTGLKVAAIVVEPSSGRTMQVITNEPGLQFYGGNFLNGSDVGKNGTSYEYRTAFCLESQHFPDSPNISRFPSTILNPNEVYTSTCIYKFDVAL